MTPPEIARVGAEHGRHRLLQREAQVIHPAPGRGVHGDANAQQPLGGVDERLRQAPGHHPLGQELLGVGGPEAGHRRPAADAQIAHAARAVLEVGLEEEDRVAEPAVARASARRAVGPRSPRRPSWPPACETPPGSGAPAPRPRSGSARRAARWRPPGRWPAGRAPDRTIGRHARRRPWRPTAGKESPRPGSGRPARASWGTTRGGRDRSRAPARGGRTRRSRRPPPASCTWPPPGPPPR